MVEQFHEKKKNHPTGSWKFFLPPLLCIFLVYSVSEASANNSKPPYPASEEALEHVPNLIALEKEKEKQKEIDEYTAKYSTGGIYTRPERDSTSAHERGNQIDFSDFRRWSGLNSNINVPTTHISRTRNEWKKLWRDYVGQWPPTDDLPNNIMAVALFLGERPSKYYSVRIQGMRRDPEDDSLYITYAEYRPRFQRENESTSQKTQPWVVYFVPAAEGQIRFKKEIRAR